MTETATESNETVEVKFDSEIQRVQFQALADFITQRNELVAKVNAATGDKDSLAESVRESDDDPEISRLRVTIAELMDQLDALVNAKVEELMTGASSNVEELKAEVASLDEKIKPGVKYYKMIYTDGTVEHLPKQARLKGVRTGGGGGGGRRIRGYNVVVTINGEATEYDNFTQAAKALDVDTKDLQEQFFAKAGVEVLKDAPDEVTFDLSWTETDENDVESEVTANVRAYRTEAKSDDSDNDKDDADEASDSDAEPTEAELEEL